MSRTILRSSRLTLREMCVDDLDFVADMLWHPEVTRFYPKRYNRHEAESWLRRQLERYQRDGHALWLAIRTMDAVPVGQIGLLMQRVGDEQLPEIGYLLHREYWSQGYAEEAARATRDHAFFELGYQRVVSLILPINAPSRRVALKLGMQYQGKTMHAGAEHDIYGIARADARTDR